MNQITLLTWPDYISPHTLEGFEKEFEVGARMEVVPSAIELIQRMRATDPGVDVLVPPDYAVRELRSLGRLAHLDHSLIPNIEHLEPRFRIGCAHDPESRVSIIKDWGLG